LIFGWYLDDIPMRSDDIRVIRWMKRNHGPAGRAQSTAPRWRLEASHQP
jgi:hypothetical protein